MLREREVEVAKPLAILVYERLSLTLFGGIARRLARAFELDKLFEEASIYATPTLYIAKVFNDKSHNLYSRHYY